MLNSEKVILMTKLAIYEQNEGKKEIPISRYFKGDYISVRMIGSFFAFTIAFVIGFSLWAVCNAEYLIENITTMDLFSFGKWVAIIYLLTLVLYLVLSYIYFAYKFKKIRRNLKNYNGELKNLHKMQQEEINNTVTDRDFLGKVVSEAKGGNGDDDTAGI